MSDAIRTRITQLRSRARGAELGRGVGRLATVLACGLIGWLVIDYWFVVRAFGAGAWDVGTRLVMTAGLLGLVGREAWRGVITEFRRLRDDDELAMRLEGAYPELAGRFISTVQLLRELSQAEHRVASPGLVEALAEETSVQAETVDHRRAWDLRPARRALGFGAVAVIIAVGLASWKPEVASAFFRRLCLMPAHYPTATRIASVTVPAMVGRGDPVVVEVRVDPTSEVPTTVTAVIRGDDGRTSKLRLDRLPIPGEAVFRGTLKQAIEDVAIRPQAGDHHWEAWEPVQVVARPVVRRLAMRLQYPEYLRIPPAELAVGDLEVPAGTVVAVDAEPSRAVIEAAISLAAGVGDPVPAPMELSADGLHATARFTAAENGSWSIGFKTGDGLDSGSPTRWTITAVPDVAPTVTATFPSRDRNVTRVARWPIRFTARDDHGLAGVGLRWQIIPPGVDPETVTAEPGKQEIAGMATAGSEAIAGETWFELASLNLSIGSRVVWWLEAHDRRTPTANLGESQKGTFNVVDPIDEQRRLLETKAELLNTIKDHLKTQKDIQAGVQGVQKAAGGQPATPTQQKPTPTKPAPKPK